MGIYLKLPRQYADSNWTTREVERTNNLQGSWTNVATLPSSDTSYYDDDGVAGNYYRFRFIAGAEQSEWSTPVQINHSNLYGNPTEIIDAFGGWERDALPNQLTENIIAKFLFDASRNIDAYQSTAYGRTETHSEIFDRYSFNNLYSVTLKHANINAATIRLQYEDNKGSTILALGDNDFAYYPTTKILKLRRFGFYGSLSQSVNLRVTYDYGTAEIPQQIVQIASWETVLKVLASVMNSSPLVPTWINLAGSEIRLGEQYVNVREAMAKTQEIILSIKASYGMKLERSPLRIRTT